LQIIEWPSGETRVGPPGRYLALELSPTGDRVAASHPNWNHCLDSDDVPAEEQTFSLISVDVETFEVTELLVDDLPMTNIQWSADGRHIAFTNNDGLVIFDVEARARVQEIPLGDQAGWNNRALFAAPDGGEYRFVYVHGRSFYGVPRDESAKVTTWTPECDTRGTLFAQRVKTTRAGEVTAYYLCGNETVGPPYSWQATIDLEDGTLAPGVEAPALDVSLGALWDIERQIRSDHPGAAMWGYVGTDYRQELFFLSTTYSPSARDVQESVRAGDGYPPDAESAVVILTPEDELIYVPIEIELRSEHRSEAYGPLHDVIILD
jgi:dipeptidyl aminopeptidase/acylaminoacyl peptidase